jgi:hypothetical protein
MRVSPSPFVDEQLRLLGRRAWVKSAVLTAASTIALSSRARSEATNRTPPQSSSKQADKATSAFGNKMVGFMLAHEQFPVMQLIELGIAADELVLISWPPVTIFNHGKRTKDTAVRRGRRWARSRNAPVGCGWEPR